MTRALKIREGLLFRPIRRVYLHWVSSRIRRLKDDSVTVIIPFRNRADQRLRNLLTSLRTQTLAPEKISIVISDYGSEPSIGTELFKLTQEFKVELVRSGIGEPWSRSRSINAALSCVSTPYVCIADVDLIFSSNYLQLAVTELKQLPSQMALGPLMDLPKNSETSSLNFDKLKSIGIPRFGRAAHPSCMVIATKWLFLMNGYDEFYQTWGYEDDDMHRRLLVFGLSELNLYPRAMYFHQWHPKHEGLQNVEKEIKRNASHFYQTQQIRVRQGRLARLRQAR